MRFRFRLGRGESEGRGGCGAEAPLFDGGLREALETLVSERSVCFRALARVERAERSESERGEFEGGERSGAAARGELERSVADFWRTPIFDECFSFWTHSGPEKKAGNDAT